jgi:hypothetical protein
VRVFLYSASVHRANFIALVINGLDTYTIHWDIDHNDRVVVGSTQRHHFGYLLVQYLSRRLVSHNLVKPQTRFATLSSPVIRSSQ